MKLTAHTITNWLFDVRVWIFVLFLVRLENINLPALDEHAWRQTITLGVARNFIEVDPNFFHPRTVICDSRGGIQAQEFPFFNYAISLLWMVFGQQNWCFRLFNLVVCSIGLYYFSKVATRMIGERGAHYATVLFAVSEAFVYARKAMPDVFAVSLVIIGVEFAWRYLEEKKNSQLAWFTLFAALGMLCKMPATCMLGLLAAPIMISQADLRTKGFVIGGASVALSAMIAWYFVWAPWAVKAYGFPLYYPTSISEGWRQLVAMKNDTLSRFYPIALTSHLAFVFFAVGLVWMIWKKQKPLLWAFAGCTAFLIVYMLKTGGTFSGHVYYVIPYVPMMALLAGYGLNESIRNKWIQIALLLVITSEAIYRHKYNFFIPWEDQKFMKLEKIVDQYVPKTSRILVNNREGSPLMMYFAHRRGWTVTDRMKDSAWVAGESTVGMDYLVLERSRWQDTLPFPKLYEDNEFQVYKTKKN